MRSALGLAKPEQAESHGLSVVAVGRRLAARLRRGINEALRQRISFSHQVRCNFSDTAVLNPDICHICLLTGSIDNFAVTNDDIKHFNSPRHSSGNFSTLKGKYSVEGSRPLKI